MFDLDNWQEIWATITRNRLRSFLTGFGVFWGLFMLIILIGLGNSIEGGLRGQFAGFATNSAFFWTGQTSVPYKGYRKGRTWAMNLQDIEHIRQRATAVEFISPMLFIGGADKNVVHGQKNGSYSVMGVLPDHFAIQGMHILQGRLFNEIDNRQKRKVCIIGKEVYETLFSVGENAIGQYIRANGIYFQVVGVVSPKARNVNIGSSPVATVYLPFSTTQVTFNQGQDIWFMACTAKHGYPLQIVEEQVHNIVKAAHSIAPADDKAMGGFNLEKQFKMFDMLFSGIHILIWIVGLGALLSGIIGISNIMLVTVRERTREIGVRRALGAKPFVIVAQILIESFVLTAIAGFFGFLFGVLILEAFYQIMIANPSPEQVFIPPFVSFWTAIWAMVILIISGIAAGLLPAIRALSIKAIDAIREE
ncbi:ABC transporter ATP-binding protein [Bacteroidia bacterium]|nr:ABC transporter ATP-binding protein [Bacteroidia bacterium]GHV45536.1 ABC transporter ATP-binding protein [Bacteroidia bacterium]